MSSPFVDMLVEMGFSKVKAEKALSVTGNQGVEPAMEWLLAHGDSVDETLVPAPNGSTAAGDQSKLEDTSSQTTESAAVPSTSDDQPSTNDTNPKSLKCNECGKLFSSQVEVEFHAVKSGHSDFSESTEEKKPLTEEERQEQLRKLEEKMRQKRQEREEREKQEALEKEKNRIKSGKEMIAAKKKLEEEEIKKVVEQRKREKIEDKLARERVREQIEADKLARKQKFGMVDSNATATSPTSATLPTPVPSTQASQAPQKDYSQTRLQIRLTNGQALTHTFGAKEQLSAVRLYVELNRTDDAGPFSLMTSFPKKIFVEDDYDKPLDILGLVPSAVVIVSKQ